MRTLAIGISTLVVVGLLQADTSSDYKKGVGPNEVLVTTYDWVDKKRDRKVPVKIYAPKSPKGPSAVTLFSHGLGGNRDACEYLGRCWASHGYVSVHIQHLGSDDALWKDLPAKERLPALKKAVIDPRHALNRPADVSFVIDQLTELNKNDGSLKGRLDLDKLGLCGHSFGAWTTLACVGQSFVTKAGKGNSLTDPRIKAAIPLSSPGPQRKDADTLTKAYATIRVPCLHMTGTKDTSAITPDINPEDRQLPFRYSLNCERYLIVFEDGDHMVFSGRGKLPGSKHDAAYQAHIQQATLAFWDAYLLKDAKAKEWLHDGGFKTRLGKDGRFETAEPKR